MSQKICIVGVGLIGGSLARSLRQNGVDATFIGCGRKVQNLEKAKALGVVDGFSTDIKEACADADIIVLAVPLGAMASVFQAVAAVLKAEALITDVGSAKACVVNDARAALGPAIARFVPGHPIAGTEQSGVEASFAELFQERRVILTPLPETNPEAVDRIRKLWEVTGAQVTDMSVAHHDEVLAATSHLPHVLAYTLVDTLVALSERNEIFEYAAGGFRDFSRIASSDPVMWRDICIANREALIAILEQYQVHLANVIQDVRDNNADALLELFERAKQARDEYTKS